MLVLGSPVGAAKHWKRSGRKKVRARPGRNTIVKFIGEMSRSLVLFVIGTMKKTDAIKV
jgi:hypothetical protein